jgi:predicted PurR-regulated permease PerM
VLVKELKLPVFIKAISILIGLIALLTVLYIGKNIIVPLIFSIIIAIILHPVVNFFMRRKINRIFAIIITLFFTFSLLAAFCGLLYSQAARFYESWPVLVDKFTLILHQSITWASGYFDIDAQKIQDWLANAKTEVISTIRATIGHTLISIGSGLMMVFLVPVYIFLMLYYQPLLIEFIRRLFAKSDQSQVSELITQTKTVIQHYLIGLIIEAIIIAIMDSLGLLILGIDYAILLGIIGALLNVIPYIGGIVAVALPMMIALTTKSTPLYALYVLGIYYFIQLIDNHYIFPKIVASKVKINMLFAILVVLAGYALWGIAGMFLSLPILALIKLIFDHIEPLKPWGFLLGDTIHPLLTSKPSLKKVKNKLI